MTDTVREIYCGRAFRKAKVIILCDGEKHWQRSSDGSRRYVGKCHDAGNCPNRVWRLRSNKKEASKMSKVFTQRKAGYYPSFEVFQKCYERLEALFAEHGGLEVFLTKEEPGYLKLKSGGFMDLSIDRLGPAKIAMAHNYIQEGDVMADPDMEVKIEIGARMAFGMTYQQDGLGVYQTADDGTGHGVNVDLRRKLSSFLLTWLTNLEHQGFYKI
jgi:hypothetical protein